MKSFQWNDYYITGLSDIDNQHQNLVEFINQFSDLLAENYVQLRDVENLYEELTDYAVNHFKEEEKMMKEVKVDTRHTRHHLRVHKRFLDDVTTIYSKISQDNIAEAESLLDFLIHWLAYHVLGEDKNLGRQIIAIQSGMSPNEAYDKLEKEQLSETAPLLDALTSLFELVTRQNRELKHLNNSLEEIVSSRTRELSDANLKLEKLSLTDPLTELPNRRYAIQLLFKLWSEALQNDLPLVCMMVDADHFKEVNDDYGHDAGDAVLIALAKRLKEALRNDDTVCRLGGDEFLVICPDTDKEAGMHLAESIRKAVSTLRPSTGGEPWHGSVSIGVAHRLPDMKNYEALIKMADLGVYAAKVDGKNCIRTLHVD
ncbi:MAG: GGDEF domain-containing protein [Proteobacteria bacterium]|nr:GGDEF domain-containing protein [Pseudomonadota bacterium]NOG58968.1 GGDEF domain-containing protein [Pseudomonadota bacterium]